MLDLLEKGFKLAILNMFKELREIMSKKIKESMRTMSKKRLSIKR